MLHLCPILIQPDPSLQFNMDVDASDSGVGAAVSQCSGPDQKLHPAPSSPLFSPNDQSDTHFPSEMVRFIVVFLVFLITYLINLKKN